MGPSAAALRWAGGFDLMLLVELLRPPTDIIPGHRTFMGRHRRTTAPTPDRCSSMRVGLWGPEVRSVWTKPTSAGGASGRLAFCTDGTAALAFASGRARTSTLAGLAAIVISSPLAGLRPVRFLVVGLTRTVSWTSPPRRSFCALPSSSRAGAEVHRPPRVRHDQVYDQQT